MDSYENHHRLTLIQKHDDSLATAEVSCLGAVLMHIRDSAILVKWKSNWIISMCLSVQIWLKERVGFFFFF